MSNSCSEGLECLGRFAGESLRGISAADSRLYVAPRWMCPVCFSRFMVLCPQSADSLLLGPRPLKVCFVMVYQASATLGSPQFCSFLYALLRVDSGPHPPFIDTIQASFTTLPTPVLNLRFLPSGKTSLTQPKSCVWHLPIVLSTCSHTMCTSVGVPVAAQEGQTGRDRGDEHPLISLGNRCGFPA